MRLAPTMFATPFCYQARAWRSRSELDISTPLPSNVIMARERGGEPFTVE
jgi:hypothetical protein